MNLEDDNSDKEDSVHEKTKLSDNENDSDSDNYNVQHPMNVFASKWILTFGVANVTRSH
jgi:hypothetical protein